MLGNFVLAQFWYNLKKRFAYSFFKIKYNGYKIKNSKKAPAKKAVAKKAMPKKAVAKKAVTKKPAVKKATASKVIAKKAVVKKPAAKKAAAAPKKGVKKIAQINPLTRQAPLVKKNKVKKAQPKKSLTAVTEVSQMLVEKAAHTSNNKLMLQTGDAVETASPDPIQAFDKNVFSKATTKGDPHSKLHLSNKPKNAIKPSGKKPLWR